MLVLSASCLVACSTLSGSGVDTHYIAESLADDLLTSYAPVFSVKGAEQSYNRIGKAEVNSEDDSPYVYVNPDHAALYAEKRSFSTDTGEYLNLIYRVHFDKTPYSLFPFYLSAGRNPGLIVVLTLNQSKEPVLLTTVQTCGCYLAIVPFSTLPKEAYPAGWDMEKQWVYGHTLPGLLHSGGILTDEKVVVTVEPGTHRVSDVGLVGIDKITARQPKRLTILPMNDLWHLPYGGKEISFFEEAGIREGYVKGSHKFLEKLLISWWALDWNVGEDKALLGDNSDGGIEFYTSLKFWRRHDSDMRNFPRFLNYWGWGL